MPPASDPAQPETAVVDAFRAQIGPGEIALELGRFVGPDASRDTVSVRLSHRIRFDQAAAARLLSALKSALQQHEARWPSMDDLGAASTRAPSRSHAEPDEAGRRAASLLREVEALGCPYYHERSFRITSGTLAANRFLLTLNAKSYAGNLREAVLGIARRLEMPQAFLGQAEAAVAGAKAVHFGFEGDGQVVYKLYFERAEARAEAEAAAAGTAVPLHLAFKWSPGAPATRAVSRYNWYPNLTVAQIAERMTAIHGGDTGSASLAIALAVLDSAAGAMNPEDLQYLEVREDGNERASYDLNVYDAGLQLKDVQEQLAGMRDRFAVPPSQFQALYDQVKGRVFGHLAGGTHRDGRDFFNVYYGVQRHDS
jgi:hypothetical protein